MTLSAMCELRRFACCSRAIQVPGGELSESRVIRGVMLNKDVTHASMRRRIEHPRVVLLDCGLEYVKPESVANLEVSEADAWDRALRNEEAAVRAMCDALIAQHPDLVITEKGVSDLAQHFLQKANITALRRVRKSDNNRLARATGATIVHRPEELSERDVGTGCGLFEVRQIGDEYFAFLEACAAPKACTVLLRGGSRDALNEIERNLQDAMQVARNVVFDPRLLPGRRGGALGGRRRRDGDGGRVQAAGEGEGGGRRGGAAVRGGGAGAGGDSAHAVPELRSGYDSRDHEAAGGEGRRGEA